ncbi:MAG: hypothetical protein IKO32_07305 [Lachnospiraceae bacterium]|nr:hypothetical protein [Lachnospiraceae bacterium]
MTKTLVTYFSAIRKTIMPIGLRIDFHIITSIIERRIIHTISKDNVEAVKRKTIIDEKRERT